MAEFMIWVVGIILGIGFCLFLLSLPAIIDILGQLRESRYLPIAIIAWILWFFFRVLCFIIVISAVIATLGLAKELVQYFINE